MVLVFLSSPLKAQSLDKLVTEFLELSKTQEILDITIKTYVDEIVANNPNADRNKLLKQFNSMMGWDVLKDQTTSLILKAYKPNDLKEIIKFLKTDAGQVYAEKSPWLSSEISKLIMSNITKLQSQASELTKQLMAVANEVNKGLPMTLDEQTRLDSTVGYDDQFTYKYTLTGYAAEEISAEQLKQALQGNLLNTYCTTEDMKFFRDNKVPVNYFYSGKNGKQIVNIAITVSDCP